MSTATHVFLVGFMGAGKTTVGRLLADRIGRRCIDLDRAIERLAGAPVARVFELEGEDRFRELETQALLELGHEPASVVACGGGVVLRPENRAALKRMGTVVYLQVTAGEAVARIGDATSRPLLSGPAGTLAATSLLAARESLYRSVADMVVDTVGKTPGTVTGEIESALESES